MPHIKYDNERDRFAHGFDAGNIVDGEVALDEVTGRFVLVDEDGVGFDPQVVLQRLAGRKVRMTIVSFESLIELEDMYQTAQQGQTPILIEPEPGKNGS